MDDEFSEVGLIGTDGIDILVIVSAVSVVGEALSLKRVSHLFMIAIP
jgi:hypothetical protein